MTWDEVCERPELQDLPYKIELDRYGRIVTSPHATPHARLQGHIAFLLRQQLGSEAFPEVPVQTVEGVKAADVVWCSAEFLSEYAAASPLAKAPEICVEVMSPSNSWAETEEKAQLYLARGAREVWICEPDGRLRFFVHAGEVERSPLAPEAPTELTLG